MSKFWRIGISLCLTAFISFLPFVFLYLYYDELHIKSTDYQLKDNLTYAQVIFGIAKTIVVSSAFSAVIAACIYWANKAADDDRSGKVAAMVCWCFMLAIILSLSVSHYRETSERMESERQWRLEQQRQNRKQTPAQQGATPDKGAG